MGNDINLVQHSQKLRYQPLFSQRTGILILNKIYLKKIFEGKSTFNFHTFLSSILRIFMIATFLALLSLVSSVMVETRERTFIMVKPDGVQRGIVGEIIKRFEAKGFKLVALKFTWVSF